MFKRHKLFFLLLISVFLPAVARADFNPDNIISDGEGSNYNTMTQVQIRDFLQSHSSYLSTYFYEGNNPGPVELGIDPAGEYFKQRSAAEIIWNASQEAKLNPQFILTTLQKEMGLVEDPSPKENALSYAMGYGCPDSGGCDFRFKGFGKQIRSAALQFRYYLDNIDQYKHRPGFRSCVDDYNPFVPCTARGTEIKPENNITAAMYVYTPHINGNKLFRSLWEKYGFALAGTVGSTPQGILPEGALVRAKDGDDTKSVYLIQRSTKLPFASLNALVSRFDPQKVLAISTAELNKYDSGPAIKFANYSLLQAEEGPRYLVDGLTKRLISSNEVFKKLGFNPDEVIAATTAELAALSDGPALELITTEASPFAKLLQDKASKALYYVKDGQKGPIIDPLIAQANYPTLKTSIVTAKILDKYADAAPIRLVDGTLIKLKNDPRVYVISAGQRRLISDGQTFETLGYNWKNILVVSNKVMNFHLVGPALNS